MNTEKKPKSNLITALRKNIQSEYSERCVLNFLNEEQFNAQNGLIAAELLMQKEKFELAARIYSKIIELEPKNINALSNLGGALVNLRQYADAETILRYVLELDSNYAPALINIGGSLQGQGKRDDVLDMALRAVCAIPKHPICHQNLGAAFHDLGKLEEARLSFETALILDPNLVDAEISIATIDQQFESKLNTALTRYQRALKIIPKENNLKRNLVKFYMGVIYLKLGELKIGWEYFENGFCQLLPAHAARNPDRKFAKPRWNGEDLNGKTLLIWREQGVGDLIIFSSVLEELGSLNGKVILEVDSRLVKTFQRSFKNFHVREQKFIENNINQTEDFDYQIPLLSLMQYYRDTFEKFKNKKTNYIITNIETDNLFQNRLKPYEKMKKIGICWRSGLLDPNRNKEYTQITDWDAILTNPDYVFINLQYGNCEAELVAAEKKFSIKILRWDDLDLKNDFDSTFSLIKNLDAIVSVSSTPFGMGGAVGIPTVVMSRLDWCNPEMDGKYPWLDSVIPIYAAEGQYIDSCLEKVPEILEEIFKYKNGA
jgi:Flp pilus assembly protein TadD